MVEKLFAESHSRAENGRHIVAIPMNPQCPQLGSSRAVALRRYAMQEEKCRKNATYKENYDKFMQEMLDLGHMVEATQPPKPNEQVYYIPHHGIFSSKSFRVVFDGSCKTSNGLSLNDAQFVGPRLQRDLREILIRFRRNEFAVSADIRKMFRQVLLTPDQWNLQRIFWRPDKNGPVKEYCIVTVLLYIVKV